MSSASPPPPGPGGLVRGMPRHSKVPQSRPSGCVTNNSYVKDQIDARTSGADRASPVSALMIRARPAVWDNWSRYHPPSPATITSPSASRTRHFLLIEAVTTVISTASRPMSGPRPPVRAATAGRPYRHPHPMRFDAVLLAGVVALMVAVCAIATADALESIP